MEPSTPTELLRHLTPMDIQWVVEWWRNKAMTNNSFKEDYVILVGASQLFLLSYVLHCLEIW